MKKSGFGFEEYLVRVFHNFAKIFPDLFFIVNMCDGKVCKTDNGIHRCAYEYRVKHDNGEILHIMGNVKLLEEDGTLFYQRFLLDCTDQKLSKPLSINSFLEA